MAETRIKNGDIIGYFGDFAAAIADLVMDLWQMPGEANDRHGCVEIVVAKDKSIIIIEGGVEIKNKLFNL